jgi:hypothetical protein
VCKLAYLQYIPSECASLNELNVLDCAQVTYPHDAVLLTVDMNDVRCVVVFDRVEPK